MAHTLSKHYCRIPSQDAYHPRDKHSPYITIGKYPIVIMDTVDFHGDPAVKMAIDGDYYNLFPEKDPIVKLPSKFEKFFGLTPFGSLVKNPLIEKAADIKIDVTYGDGEDCYGFCVSPLSNDKEQLFMVHRQIIDVVKEEHGFNPKARSSNPFRQLIEEDATLLRHSTMRDRRIGFDYEVSKCREFICLYAWTHNGEYPCYLAHKDVRLETTGNTEFVAYDFANTVITEAYQYDVLGKKTFFDNKEIGLCLDGYSEMISGEVERSKKRREKIDNENAQSLVDELRKANDRCEDLKTHKFSYIRDADTGITSIIISFAGEVIGTVKRIYDNAIELAKDDIACETRFQNGLYKQHVVSKVYTRTLTPKHKETIASEMAKLIHDELEMYYEIPF